nr:MAG TPA: hypothetical protein [Bacteriophage sp.]
MMIHHGMRIDDFLAQDLEWLLRASHAADQPEFTFIDEL